MKHETCPRCGSTHLGSQWWYPRLLKQFCRGCGWWGEPVVPWQQEVTGVKTVSAGSGFEYTVYDRYGHVMVYSQSYPTEAEVEAALAEEMKRSATDEHCGPYTAVLWPARVEIHGKIFKGATDESVSAG